MTTSIFPNHWMHRKLNDNDLFSFESGTWTGKHPPLIDCAVVRNTNFTNDGRFDFSNVAVIKIEERQLARKRLQTGDIIVERSGGGPQQPVGRVALFDLNGDQDFCFSNFTSRLRVLNKNVVNPYYLHLFLLHFHMSGQTEVLQRRTTGIRNLSFSDYKNTSIPLPPLPEQRTIALTLRAVQDARDTRRRELALERERKAALMEKLFTCGTRGEVCKETEIGPMPQSWRIVRFGEIFETQLGKMLSPKSKTGNGSKPYLRNANVQWGRVQFDDIHEMDFTEAEMQKFNLRCGDLLMCEGGEIGRTAVWSGEIQECYFQKAIHRIRPRNHNVSSEFFLHFLEWAFRIADLYRVAGTQTTIAHLPKEKLVAMWVSLPLIEEQQDIADVLTACDRKIAALEAEATLQDELFRALLEELMSGPVSTLPLVAEGVE